MRPKNSGGLDHLRPERRRPALEQATHPTQRHFNRSSTLVRDRGRMTTRWTFRLARVWVAQFTASGPEDYADYADCDADPRRVRREPAAIRVRFPHIRFHMSAGRSDRADEPAADLWPRHLSMTSRVVT